MKRFHIHTFGCQMNVHDSRRIREVLRGEGYEPSETLESADLVVFNTCSVRDKADHKLLSAVGAIRPLKEARKDMVVAVTGCMAQAQGASLLKRLPLVDLLVGPDNLPELPSLLRQVEGGAPPMARTEFDLERPTFLTARVHPDEPESSAFVTIMKGCDERCTYCIVPYTRGSERYRSGDEIVAEVTGLVAGGVKEITLLGQTVNSWYEPTGPAPAEGDSQFPQLLRRLAQEVPDLVRVRYTSPHPRHVTPELVAAHSELDNLPAHVHLPVQSGSDRILKRMLRRYTRAEFVQRARALQAARPGFTLSTDLIVGFPSETEEDFVETLSLIREVGFVAVFAFKYSPRPHTPALKLEDDVSEAVKSERLARVFEVVDELQQAHLKSLVGSRTRVLFERPSKSGPGYFTGRSDRHEIVHAHAPEGADLTGQHLHVRIDEANKRSLMAVLLDPVPDSAYETATQTRRRRLPMAAG